MTNTFKGPLQKAVVTWLTNHPDVSKSALAAQAEIDQGDISRICSGAKLSLNMESAGRLAQAMGTTVEALLHGETTPAELPAGSPNGVRLAAAAAEVGARMIELKDIVPSGDNPRKTFDEEALAELAASIAEQGLLQPIVVRPFGMRFEIIAGERRYRALKLNKAVDALCIVRDGDDEPTARALRIIENLQREDIKPLEEADAFAALNDLDPVKWTATAIGRAIGKSDRFVAQRLAMARHLADDLKEKLAKGELKVEVARVLATAPVKLQKVVAKNEWDLRDADTVRRKLQDKAIPLTAAAFKVEQYDGEFLEEGGKKWFADKAKFGRLQSAAADAKVEKLKKTFPTAQRVNPNQLNDYVWADDGEQLWSYWGPDRSEAKSRKRGLSATDCTALVWIRENKVRVAKNVVLRTVWNEKVEKQEPEADGAPSHRRDNSKEEKQVRAVNTALTEAMGSRPDLAKRLVVYAFLGSVGYDFEIQINPLPYLGDQAEALAPLILNPEGGDFEPYDPRDAEDDKLWALLRAMDDASVDGLLSRLMSDVLHIGLYSRADGLQRTIAAELGVSIPDRFLPGSAEDAEDGEGGDFDDDTGETGDDTAEAA